MDEDKQTITQVLDQDLKLAVENAYDHVIVTDKGGVIIFANKGVERVTGFTIPEVLGTKAGKLWGGMMTKEFYVSMWAKLLSEKQPWVGEMINRRKNGEVYTADVRISPILDQNGEIVKFIGIERDISIYKKAEAQAATEKAIITSLGECLVVTDSEGNIQMVNKAFEEVTGYRFNEIKGQPMLTVLPKVNEKGEKIPDQDRSLSLVLAGKLTRADASTVTDTHYYLLKNGKKLPIAGAVTPIYINGKLFGAVQVFRDITEDKAVDRMKTDILSLAAHQLKTPIGQLSAYIDNMLSGVVGNFTPEQHEYLVNMDLVLGRLASMTMNILNASRIERGVIQYNIHPINLKRILELIVNDYQAQAQTKGLRFSYLPAIDCMVAADEIKLKEVIGNIVDNAIKFTEKGEIAIESAIVDNQAVITIRDTGPGIDQKMLAQLFERDKDLDNAVSAKTGSRLGLYIANIFMQKQGGGITVSSTVGKGTSFKISIALAK